MPTEINGFVIFGAIEEKWLSFGGFLSLLKLPISNEAPTFDGIGRRQHFQGGMVSWYPATGAYAVWGSIGARWLQIGGEQFGYPITDESPTPDGIGRFNHFRAFRPDGSVIGDSSIYWTPETGAHEVYGAIRDFWAAHGWETSEVGYPVNAEQDRRDGPGREQQFQFGQILWSPETGAWFGRYSSRKLQFRLRGFDEHESTDSGLQGASDEVYISALGVDSSAIHVGPEGGLIVDQIEAPVIGDVSNDEVRGPWNENPHVLLEFDLEREGHWPRTYVVTLLIVEEDNQDLADKFNEVINKVGNEARSAITASATTSGVVVGSAVLPGIGTAVGAAAGFLAGLAWDTIIEEIGQGLANEAFSPQILKLELPMPTPMVPSPHNRPQSIIVEQHEAKYGIHYDWHITRTR